MAKVAGLKRIPGEKLIRTKHGRVWFCDGCNAAFEWDENSSYHGSLRNVEEEQFHEMWIACSAECAALKPPDFPKKRTSPRSREDRE